MPDTEYHEFSKAQLRAYNNLMDIKPILKDMGLPEDTLLISDIDELQTAEEICASLEGRMADPMAIQGDWRPANAKNIDIYDLALKFAEDNFYRIRSRKSGSEGYYIVIVAEKINEIHE